MSTIIVSLLGGARASASLAGETSVSAIPTLRVRTLHASAEILGETILTAEATLRTQRIFRSASFSGETNITADGHGISATASVFRGRTDITARARTRLPLVNPAPILNEVSEGSFSKQFYTARLLDSLGNQIKIERATIEAPRGAIGKRVSVSVAKKDLSLITTDKTYTFQIGTRETPTGAITWETIVTGGNLDSRNFALGAGARGLPADTLTFGTIGQLKNRLNKYPKDNVILYNSRKTSIELDGSDYFTDTSGLQIATNLIAVNYLTLSNLLNYIKKNCGFADIVTNIPNFELTRVDIPITSSFFQALSSVVGVFEPVIFERSGTLYIIDKTAALPDDFTPRALSNAVLSNWSISVPEAQEIDGFLLSYSSDATNSNYFTTRVEHKTEESGTFGESDYSRTETETIYREWRSFAAPAEILRSEIVARTIETYVDFITLGSRRTENHSFDSQGRRKSSTVTTDALVPSLPSGAPVLQTVREETQNVFYSTDPKNPQRSIQSRVSTRIRGLIAVDSENTYFDPDTGEQADFRQDFMEAHKAGNLRETMTTDYGPLKTVTETLHSLGGGQYQMNVSTVDHLRKTETSGFTEPKTGDASLASSQSRQNRLLVLPEGVTNATRAGNAIETLAAGDLPLFFAVPLARRKIEVRRTKKHTGTASIIGYSSSIERGTFFTLEDRSGNPIARLLTAGFRVEINALGDGCTVRTDLDADEI